MKDKLENLKQQIQNLESRSKILDPTESDRNKSIEKVQNFANNYINTIHETPAYSDKDVENNSLAFRDGNIPLFELLNRYAKQVAGKGINPASGGHIGYIPGGGIFASALADFLADITNDYAGIYYASPGAVTIENEMLDWLKSIFGFPKSAVGNLTSGGSIANLIALTSARDEHKVKSEKIAKSVVYLSSQAHHCITKSLRIIGLEDVIIRYVQLDNSMRIDVDKLKTQIKHDNAQGLHPFLIVASAGTTDTGVIDPLKDLALVAHNYKMWLHVDAAYGGFFILTRDKKHLFDGIEMADSLVIDPHKGMFLPYGTGAVLVKNQNRFCILIIIRQTICKMLLVKMSNKIPRIYHPN